MPGRIANEEDHDLELPVAKMARFALDCEENQRPSNLVSSTILKAGRRVLTPISVKQIPLASGNILLADVNQFFASFIPGNRNNAKKTKAQEFFDYLIQPTTTTPSSEE